MISAIKNNKRIFSQNGGSGAGSGDKNYVHTQSVAATTWNVNHNLDKKCSVQIVDNDENQITASIEWTDDNNVVITFNSATAGYAYCN